MSKSGYVGDPIAPQPRLSLAGEREVRAVLERVGALPAPERRRSA